MNLYLVLSETLYYVEPVLDYGQGPEMPYRIYEMVFAKSPSQARYLAWKKDSKGDVGDIRDMPKFKVRTIAYNLDVNESRVINGNPYIRGDIYNFINIEKVESWAN